MVSLTNIVVREQACSYYLDNAWRVGRILPCYVTPFRRVAASAWPPVAPCCSTTFKEPYFQYFSNCVISFYYTWRFIEELLEQTCTKWNLLTLVCYMMAAMIVRYRVFRCDFELFYCYADLNWVLLNGKPNFTHCLR